MLDKDKAALTNFLLQYCARLEQGLSAPQAIDEIRKLKEMQFKPELDRFIENYRSEKSVEESFLQLGADMGTELAKMICSAMALHLKFGTSAKTLKEFVGMSATE